MKKKLIIKIVVTFILIGIVLGVFLYQKLKEQPVSNSGGTVTIIIINKEKVEMSNRQISFQKGEKLLDMLVANYDVVAADGAYGKVLYGIDGVVTDFKHSYLAIYVNDQYLEVGISYAELKDGLVIKFVETLI